MIEEIESRAGARFAPMQHEPWELEYELPTSVLKTDGVVAFRYPPAVVAESGPKKARDLVNMANRLLSYFPYNDRGATGKTRSGAKGIFVVELVIDAYDPSEGRPEKVTLAWVPVGDEGVLAMAYGDASPELLLGKLPNLKRIGTIEEITLGHG